MSFNIDSASQIQITRRSVSKTNVQSIFLLQCILNKAI